MERLLEEEEPPQRRDSRRRGSAVEEAGIPMSSNEEGRDETGQATGQVAGGGGSFRSSSLRAKELCRRVSSLVSLPLGDGATEDRETAPAGPRYHLVSPVAAASANTAATDGRLSSTSNTTLSGGRDSSESEFSRQSAKNSFSDNESGPWAFQGRTRSATASAVSGRAVSAEWLAAPQAAEAAAWRARLRPRPQGEGAGRGVVGVGAAATVQQHQLDNLILPRGLGAATAEEEGASVRIVKGRWVQRPKNPTLAAAGLPSSATWRKGTLTEEQSRCTTDAAARRGASFNRRAAYEAARSEQLEGTAQEKAGGAAAAATVADCPAALAGETAAVAAAAEEEAVTAAPEEAAVTAAVPEETAAAGEPVSPAAAEDTVAARGAGAASAAGDAAAEEAQSDVVSSEDSERTSRVLSKRSAWSRRSTTGGACDSNPNGYGGLLAPKNFATEEKNEEEEEAAATGDERRRSSIAAAAAEDIDELPVSDERPRPRHTLLAALQWLLACCCCCVTARLWERNSWMSERWKRRRGCRWGLVILLLLTGLLLVFLPIFFIHIMPHIIAAYVRGGGVKVLSTTMRRLRPAAFEAAVSVEFLTYVPIHVDVTDTEVDVFFQDDRIGHTSISDFSLGRSSRDTTFVSDFHVENMPAWEGFLRQLFTHGSSEWHMRGTCTVKFFGLTYTNVPISKVLDVEGPTLSSSGGTTPFVVKQVDMSSSTPTAIVARVTVEYNNSSTSSVESIGQVKFAMLFNGFPVGVLNSVGPIGMKHGSNIYTFVASMSYEDVKALLQTPAGAATAAAAAKAGRSSNSGSTGGAGHRRLAADSDDESSSAGDGPPVDSSASAAVAPNVVASAAERGGERRVSGSGGGGRTATGDKGREREERSLLQSGNKGGGEEETVPEHVPREKQNFLSALSELTSAALSGDATAKVVCVGVESTEPLFSKGLAALSMESSLEGLFDDDEEGGAGGKGGEIGGRVRKKAVDTRLKGPRPSPFFKGMAFHKFSLAPPADADAPPDDADVTALVTVRILNPLGTAHPFSIDKVRMEAVLRHGSTKGNVLGYVRGELLPCGPPQQVAALNAPFVRHSGAAAGKPGAGAGAAAERQRAAGKSASRRGGAAAAEDAQPRRKEKKYNYPDAGGEEEKVPSDLSEDFSIGSGAEDDYRGAHLFDLPATPRFSERIEDDSWWTGSGEESDTDTVADMELDGTRRTGAAAETETLHGTTLRPATSAASARPRRQTSPGVKSDRLPRQQGRRRSSARDTASAGGAGRSEKDSVRLEEDGERRRRRQGPSRSSQTTEAVQREEQPRKQEDDAAAARDREAERRLGAAGGERPTDESDGQMGEGSPKLPNASVMDLTFEMRGQLHVLDEGAAFAAFMREMASEERVTIAFTETHAKLAIETGVGKLQLHDVQLDGEEQLDGMASMKNVNVESFHVIGEVEQGRTWLLETRVVFPSSAPTSVYIGDLGLALAFEGVTLGWMAGRNVKIEEGGEAIQFVGMLRPPPEAAGTVSRFFSAALGPAEEDEEEGDSETEEVAAGREDEEEEEELLLLAAQQRMTRSTDVEETEDEIAADAGGWQDGRRVSADDEGAVAEHRRGEGGRGLRGKRRAKKVRAVMDVTITTEALKRVRETLEAAVADDQEGRIAQQVATLLQVGEEEQDEEKTQRTIPWISRGLENMQLAVPCPTLGSASEMIQSINMEEVRLDLTSSAAAKETPAELSTQEGSRGGGGGRGSVGVRGEVVPLAGTVELIVSNPLGSRLVPRIEQVEMDVLLLAALPAEEAAIVPTPSGDMRPVDFFLPASGKGAAGAAGTAAAGRDDSSGAAAGGERPAASIMHKVPVGRMSAALPGVTVTPLTTGAARARIAAAAKDRRPAAAPSSSGEGEVEVAAVDGDSPTVSSSSGSTTRLSGGESAAATGGSSQQRPTKTGTASGGGGDEDEEEAGAMLLLRVPLSASLQLLGSGESFTEFVIAVFESPAVEVTFRGEAACLMRTGFGDINVTGIDVSASISVKGLNGLEGSTVTSLTIEGLGCIDEFVRTKRAAAELQDKRPAADAVTLSAGVDSSTTTAADADVLMADAPPKTEGTPPEDPGAAGGAIARGLAAAVADAVAAALSSGANRRLLSATTGTNDAEEDKPPQRAAADASAAAGAPVDGAAAAGSRDTAGDDSAAEAEFSAVGDTAAATRAAAAERRRSWTRSSKDSKSPASLLEQRRRSTAAGTRRADMERMYWYNSSDTDDDEQPRSTGDAVTEGETAEAAARHEATAETREEEQGLLLSLEVEMHNSGDAEVALGCLDVDLYHQEARVGRMSSTSCAASLLAGTNKLSFVGGIILSPETETAVSSLFSRSMRNEALDVHTRTVVSPATATAAAEGGDGRKAPEDRPQWLTRAMDRVQLMPHIPPLGQLLPGMEISDLLRDFELKSAVIHDIGEGDDEGLLSPVSPTSSISSLLFETATSLATSSVGSNVLSNAWEQYVRHTSARPHTWPSSTRLPDVAARQLLRQQQELQADTSPPMTPIRGSSPVALRDLLAETRAARGTVTYPGAGDEARRSHEEDSSRSASRAGETSLATTTTKKEGKPATASTGRKLSAADDASSFPTGRTSSPSGDGQTAAALQKQPLQLEATAAGGAGTALPSDLPRTAVLLYETQLSPGSAAAPRPIAASSRNRGATADVARYVAAPVHRECFRTAFSRPDLAAAPAAAVTRSPVCRRQPRPARTQEGAEAGTGMLSSSATWGSGSGGKFWTTQEHTSSTGGLVSSAFSEAARRSPSTASSWTLSSVFFGTSFTGEGDEAGDSHDSSGDAPPDIQEGDSLSAATGSPERPAVDVWVRARAPARQLAELPGFHPCSQPSCVRQQERTRTRDAEDEEEIKRETQHEEPAAHRLVFSALSHVHARHPFGQSVVPMRVKAVSFHAVVYSGSGAAAAAQQQQRRTAEQQPAEPAAARLGTLVIPLTPVLPPTAPRAEAPPAPAAAGAADAETAARGETAAGAATDRRPAQKPEPPRAAEDPNKIAGGTQGSTAGEQNGVAAAVPTPDSDNMDFSFELERAELLLEEAGEPLGAAIAAFLENPEAGFPLYMKGTAGVQLDMGYGLATLLIEDIPVERAFTLGNKREEEGATEIQEREVRRGSTGEAARSEPLFSTSMQSFNFDGIHPAGGMWFSATAQMENSMPVAVVLPPLLFSLYYKETLLGFVWTKGRLHMRPTPEVTVISLRGQLLQQTDPSDLSRLNELAEVILSRSGTGRGGATPAATASAGGDGSRASAATAQRPQVTVKPQLDRALLQSFLEENRRLSQEQRHATGMEGEEAAAAEEEEEALSAAGVPLPLWLRRALQALEVHAPVESEKLFAEADFVKHVQMQRVAVHVEGGPTQPIHVEADVLLQLANPFDASEQAPRRSSTSFTDHSPGYSSSSPAGDPDDVPTFAIQSLQLAASIGAAAADSQQARHTSSSSSPSTGAKDAMVVFGTLQTPLLQFSDGTANVGQTHRRTSSSDPHSPSSAHGSGHRPATTAAASASSDETHSPQSSSSPATQPFHGRRLAHAEDEATAAAAAETGAAAAAAATPPTPPRTAQGAFRTAETAAARGPARRRMSDPGLAERHGDAAAADNGIASSSGRSGRWRRYPAADHAPVDNVWVLWDTPAKPGTQEEPAVLPGDVRRQREHWEDLIRVRQQILHPPRLEQERGQRAMMSALLQQRQEPKKEGAAAGRSGPRQALHEREGFGRAGEAGSLMETDGSWWTGRSTPPLLGTAAAAGGRGLTCVPLDIYEGRRHQCSLLVQREKELELQLEELQVEELQQRTQKKEDNEERQQHAAKTLRVRQLLDDLRERRIRHEAARREAVGSCMLPLPFEGNIDVSDEDAFVEFALQSVVAAPPSSCTTSAGDRAAGGGKPETASRHATGPAGSSTGGAAVECTSHSSRSRNGGAVVVRGSAAVVVETPLGTLTVGHVPVQQQVVFEQMQDIVESAAHGVKMLNFEILDVSFGDLKQGQDSISFRANVALGTDTNETRDEKEIPRQSPETETGNEVAVAEKASSSGSWGGRKSETQFEVHAGTLTLDLLMDSQIVGTIVAKNIVLGRTGDAETATVAGHSKAAGRGKAAEEASAAASAVQVDGTLSDVSRHRGSNKSKLLQLMQSAVSGRPLPLLLRTAKQQQVARPSWLLSVIDSMRVTPSLSGLMSSLALVESMRLRQVKIQVIDAHRLGIDAVVLVSANNPLNSDRVQVRLEEFSADVHLFQKAQPQERKKQQEGKEGEEDEEMLLGVLRLARRVVPADQSRTPAAASRLQFQVPLSYDMYGDQLILEGNGAAFGKFIAHVIQSDASLPPPCGTASTADRGEASGGETATAAPAGDTTGGEAGAVAVGDIRYVAVVSAKLMTTFGPLVIEDLPLSAEVNILESLLPVGGRPATEQQQEKQEVQQASLRQEDPQQTREPEQQQQQQQAKPSGTVLKGKGLVSGVKFDVRSLRFDADTIPVTPAAAAAPAAAAFLKHVTAASLAAEATREKQETREDRQETTSAPPRSGVGFAAEVALELPLDVGVSLGTLVFGLEIPTTPYTEDSEAEAAAAADTRPSRDLSSDSGALGRRLAEADEEEAAAAGASMSQPRTGGAARRTGGGGGAVASEAATQSSAAAEARQGRSGWRRGQQQQQSAGEEEHTVPLGWLVLPSMEVRGGQQTVVHARGFIMPPAGAMPLVSRFFSACVRGEQPLVLVRGVAAMLPTASEEEAAAVAARAAAAAMGERVGTLDDTGAGPATEGWLQHVVTSLLVPAPVPSSMQGFVTESFDNLEMRHLSLSAVSPLVVGRDDRVAIGASVSARIASPLGPQSPLVLRHVAVDVRLHRRRTPPQGRFTSPLLLTGQQLSSQQPLQQQAGQQRQHTQQPQQQAGDPQQQPQQPEQQPQESEEQRLTPRGQGSSAAPDTGSHGRRLTAGEDDEAARESELRANGGGDPAAVGASGGGDGELVDEETDLELVGRLELPSLPFRQTGNLLEAEVTEALLILDDNGDSFAELAVSLLNGGQTVSLYVRGTTSVLVDTALGRLQLEGLPLKVTVPVAGMALFDGNALGALAEGALEKLRVWDIDDDEWLDGSGAAAAKREKEGEEEEEEAEGSGAFHLSTQLTLHNTNDVSAVLGDMVFDVSYEGETIAAVVVSNFRMQPGDNELFLEGVVKPQGVAAFSALASAFFINKQYTLGVKGVSGGEADDGAAAAQIPQAVATTGDRSSCPFFAGSSPPPSEAAILAVRRCGVTTRPPRWLRLVLNRVQFSIPISGRGSSSGDGSSETGDASGTDEFSVAKLVREVQVLSVDVDFSGPRNPVIGGELRVHYDLPSNFKIRHTILSMSSTVTLFHESSSTGSHLIGSMHLHEIIPTFSAQVPESTLLQEQEEHEPERQLQETPVIEESELATAPLTPEEEQQATAASGQRQKDGTPVLRKWSAKIKQKLRRPEEAEQRRGAFSEARSASGRSSSSSVSSSRSAAKKMKDRLERWASRRGRSSGGATSASASSAEVESGEKPSEILSIPSQQEEATAGAPASPPPGPSSVGGDPAERPRRAAAGDDAEQRQKRGKTPSTSVLPSAGQPSAGETAHTRAPEEGSAVLQRSLAVWREWKEKLRASKEKKKDEGSGSRERKLAAAYGVVDDEFDEEDEDFLAQFGGGDGAAAAAAAATPLNVSESLHTAAGGSAAAREGAGLGSTGQRSPSDDAEGGRKGRISARDFFTRRGILSALGLESESNESLFKEGSPAPNVSNQHQPRSPTGGAATWAAAGATTGAATAVQHVRSRGIAAPTAAGATGGIGQKGSGQGGGGGGGGGGRSDGEGKGPATAEPTAATRARARLDFSITQVTLVVAEGAETAMANMLTEMVQGKGMMNVRVVGDANLILQTGVGRLRLRSIPVNLLQQFKCIGGLEGKRAQSVFNLSNFGVERGLSDALHTSADLQLRMPKAVKNYSVRLGRLQLELFMPVTEQQRSRLGDFQLLHPAARPLVRPHPQLGHIIKIGDIVVDDLSVPSDAERQQAVAMYGTEPTLKGKAILLPTPLTIDGTEAYVGTPVLMSNYMNGSATPLVVKGSPQSSANPILAGFFSSIEVAIDLAGTPVKLVRKIKLLKPDSFSIVAATQFMNPMAVPILLYYVNFTPSVGGQVLPPIVIDKRGNPEVLPPLQVSMSPPVTLPLTGEMLLGALRFVTDRFLSSSSAGIEAKGEVQVGIQEFRVTLRLHVKNLGLGS